MTQIWNSDKVVPVTLLEIEKETAEMVFEAIKEGDRVQVSGISKGKGFQGVVKRHGFKGDKASDFS